MATIDQLLEDIDASPGGPEIAAIFDFDGTLIAGYSATAFIREQVRRGDLSPREFLELMRAMGSFGLGNLGFSGMMAINAQFMRGIEEETYVDVGEQLYTREIARLIYPESRALVKAHLAKGHTVAIISSATPYQVLPAAQDLDIEHVLCTHLEVKNGRFSGGVVRPTCFGQGKVDAAESLASKKGADLEQSFFYSDSTDDQLLLERVGRPRALNPSKKLERLARANHWPVVHFGSRGRPSVGEFVRSVAATSSLVTSFVAGLPIYALTGSRRDANNFSFSLFADTASALIGLNLRVKGEEHLWSHRPAVFIFNHQSGLDAVLKVKMLRRDVTGVGKQEVRSNPNCGPLFEVAGVVYIDRADTTKAIRALKPAEEAKRQGRSLVIAPEGTRSATPRLGRFKKGAFHIAMQAGVPIVHVVFRNVLDSLPKHALVLRPATIEAVVLPPVDTRGWKREHLDAEIEAIRNRYLEVLEG